MSKECQSSSLKSSLRVRRIKKTNKEVYSLNKEIVLLTTTFLNIPDTTELNKARNYTCCIQNFLPDDCSPCHNCYGIANNETPMLECSMGVEPD